MLYNLSNLLNGISLAFFAMAGLHTIITARRIDSRPHYIFASCLVWMVLIETKEFFISQDPLYDFEILGAWFTFPDLFTLPLLSLFFFELVMPGRVTVRYSLQLLTPFLLLFAAYLAGLFFYPRPIYLSLEQFLDSLPTYLTTVLLIYLIYTIGYCIFAVWRVIACSLRYAQEIADAYSFTERIHLQWMRWMAAFMAFYLLAYIVTIAYASSIVYTVFIYALTLAVWSLLYGYITTYSTPEIIRNYWRKPASVCEEFAIDNCERTALLRQQVAAAIDERQLYLNPCLTIIDLAAECRTNRTHLSQFLNAELGLSFRDYINRCRIEYATHILVQDTHKVEELALLSGFGSTATFYRAFAKEKGMTPKQWLERSKTTPQGGGTIRINLFRYENSVPELGKA